MKKSASGTISAFSRRAFLVFGIFSIGAAPLHAETLQEALAKAYTGNPSLLAERAALRATDELVPEALSNYRPNLSASGEIGKTTQNSKSAYYSANENLTPQTGRLTLRQPIYRGGRTLAQTRQAEYQIRAGRAHLMDAEQKVLLAAATAYMDVLRNTAILELNQKNEQVLNRQLEAVRDQFSVGDVSRTDVSQAEARLAGATAGRIKAEGDLEAVRATYRNVIGDYPGALSRPDPFANFPATIESALETSSQYWPPVVAASYEEKAAEEDIALARGAFLPTVNLKGELSHSEESSSKNSERESAEFLAELSVPLYQGGAESAKLRQARQLAQERRLKTEEARRQAREETTRNWELLETARARIKSIQAQIQANEIALEGVREEAKVGARTILDILDAEKELLDSRVSLTQAERDEYVASYQLLSALGALSAKNLALPVEYYDEAAHYEDVRNKIWGFGE